MRESAVPPAFVPPFEIATYSATATPLPASWVTGPNGVEATTPFWANVPDSRAAIANGARKYPTQFLKRHLRKAVICGSLRVNGNHIGGTNAWDTVFLVGCYDGRWPEIEVERVFHHEVSSILLRKHYEMFDEDGWRQCNEPDFRYGKGGHDAVNRGLASRAFSEELAANGFIYQYAKSSIENDFNGVAEWVFCGDDNFWRCVDKYPRLRSKVELFAKFYQRVDPAFSLTYFEALRKVAKPPGS